MDPEPVPASNWQLRLLNYLFGPQPVIQLATTKFLAEEGRKEQSTKQLSEKLESSMTINAGVSCVAAFFVNELLKSRFKRYGSVSASSMLMQVTFATLTVGLSCIWTIGSYRDQIEGKRKELILSLNPKYLKCMRTLSK